MAYKVSYKVVSEQGEQLKKTAKDMDNYINQMNQIISKLGNDELLQSVRSDLKKFVQQLETERTVLNLAGQILSDVVQSYSGTEKKSVAKVDKAKAHNRDFYKRPVAVASAGGGAATATASAASYGGGGGASATVINQTQTVVNNTFVDNSTAVFNEGPSAADAIAGVTGGFTGGASSAAGASSGVGAAAAAGIAAAAGLAGAAGGVAAKIINDKRKEGSEVTEEEVVEAT